jgi:hypothetical protein
VSNSGQVQVSVINLMELTPSVYTQLT